MNVTFIAFYLSGILFLAMLAMIEIGRRIGTARIVRNPPGLAMGVSATEGAVYGLMGLVIAFTFAGAAERFENRRHVLNDEANAIGTAFLRINVVPEAAQSELRDLFRDYLDLRLETYSKATDRTFTERKLSDSVKLQETIWAKALAACGRPDTIGRPELLLLPALNEMFNITTMRTAATSNHPPLIIFILLWVLSLISALLVGYDISANKHRPWLHSLVFAAIVSLSFYVIIDLEFPRLGLIRIDSADQILIELRQNLR